MRHFALVGALAFGLFFCISCGGRAQLSSADAGDAAAPDARMGGACGSARVPEQHRAVAQACPAERGSSAPFDMSGCSNRAGITCTKDADCTAGLHGRCLAHNEPCDTACSYDECSTDADCATGPCQCRSSSLDTIANRCLSGSDCKTDADCGNCGYCSWNATPAGLDCRADFPNFVCHTAHDACTDQSDCDGGFCSYDSPATGWVCGSCIPISHPR